MPSPRKGRSPEEQAAQSRDAGKKGGRPKGTRTSVRRSSTLTYFSRIPKADLELVIKNTVALAMAGDRDALKLVAPVILPTAPISPVDLSAFDLGTLRGILEAKKDVVALGAEDGIPPEKQRQVLEGLSSLEHSIDGGKLEAELEALTAKLEAIGVEGVGRATVVPLRPVNAG